MIKVQFRWEEITANKTIVTDDRTIQVGFVNHGDTNAFVNDFLIPPTPKVFQYLLASTILWHPVNHDENDDTQYKIRFKIIDPKDQTNLLKVIYKIRS